MADGGKNKKYGRSKRTPSNAMQKLRTERNKARKIKRAAEQKKATKCMSVPRGAARAARRFNAAAATAAGQD